MPVLKPTRGTGEEYGSTSEAPIIFICMTNKTIILAHTSIWLIFNQFT